MNLITAFVFTSLLLEKQVPIYLDVGCGTGQSTIDLWKRGTPKSVIIGIDKDIECIRKAQSRYSRLHYENVFFLHTSLEEFTTTCRKGSIQRMQIYHTFSDAQHGDVDTTVSCTEHLLCPHGVVDIQDYLPSFLYSEIDSEHPRYKNINSCFDWRYLERQYSRSHRYVTHYSPTLSSRRVIYQKRDT